MTRRRQHREAPELAAFLGRMCRAMARRAGEGDLEVLSALADTQRRLDESIADSARALHAFGYSWSEIGRELGTTKQNAAQRFAIKGEHK